MRRYLAARLVQSLIVVLLVTTISFFLIRLAPGDPFSFESAVALSPALRDQLREQFGYRRPLPVQFMLFVGNVARGNLGYSPSLHRVVGISLGALQAVRRGTRLDRALSNMLSLFYSVPDFWLALIVLLAFGYWLPILPAGGMIDTAMHDYMSLGGRLLDRVRHLVLPALTLTLLAAAGIARFQRAALLEVLPQDYVRTARAKGVAEREVVLKHALRNALLPVITLLGLLLPALVGGAFFVEKVFAWPGMGSLAANAINTRDYDLVTGTVIIGGVMVTVGSLVADLLYAVADPRLRAR